MVQQGQGKASVTDCKASQEVLYPCVRFIIIIVPAKQHIQAIITAQILPKCFLLS